MIATFLSDLIESGAVNMRGAMDRSKYEYLYILCDGLRKAGYVVRSGKVVKPARWSRRVR